jgi:hypothetical protein
VKAASRPQYYRIKRIVDMVREGSAEGYLPSRSDFRRELEVSPRTLARDLDFLRDEERAPIEYDARAHGYRLTDETYRLPPVRLSRKEAFSFALVRKLLAIFEGTPLDMDMRSVLAKIAESLEGEISVEPEWLGEHVSVLAEDRVQVDPALWAQAAGFLERRETFRADYQTFAGKMSAYELGPPAPAGLPRQLVPAGAQRGQGPGRELRPVAFSAHRGAGQDLRPPAGLRCPRPCEAGLRDRGR